MRSLTRTIILIFIGFCVGALFFSLLKRQNPLPLPSVDSLMATQVIAASQKVDNANQQISTSRVNSITQAVAKVSPAVISVNVMQLRQIVERSPFSSRDPFLREFFPELFKDKRYQQEVQEIGSGFIISTNGYILTNHHVVQDANKIVITMPGGKKADARVVGTDPTTDIALLKIDMDNLPYTHFGDSDQIILGEWVIAIGNPFGLFEINNRSTVTVGVVSAVDRDFGEMEGRIYQDMIQTDASINRGNSGGPLCNALGDVIGMNTFIYTGSQYSEGSVGIGFAIPINRISRLIEDLKKYHEIDRDFWVGIKIQNLDNVIAKKMGYNGTDGVLVHYIDRGSPAEKAGMHLGDIITEIDSVKITSDKDVFEIIYGSDLRVGDHLSITVWRDGTLIKLSLVLVSLKNN
jgi:serine protease Do